MRKQETHSGTVPIFRLIETTGTHLFRVLDWIAGSAVRGHDEDSIRRCLLLVASILVIFLFAQSPSDRVPHIPHGAKDGTKSKNTHTLGEQVHSQDGQQGMFLLNRVLGSQRLPSGT